MNATPPTPVTFRRCLSVQAASTAAAAGVVLAARPLLGLGPDPAFPALLEAAAAWALVACAGWWWLGTTLVVGALLRGRRPGRAALPAPVWRAVLVACGVVALGAGPAVADPGAPPRVAAPGDARALQGLPLPERPPASLSTAAWVTGAAGATTSHVVRPGDSLWSIAAAQLPPDAGDATVDRLWRRIHARNRARIGPNPDLLHPGLRLDVPRPRPGHHGNRSAGDQ